MIDNTVTIGRIPNSLGNENITKERKSVVLIKKYQRKFFVIYFFIGNNRFPKMNNVIEKSE
jgi:hypothetical protein